jgi:hypothetical protein
MLLTRLAVLAMLAAGFPLSGAPWIGHGPVGVGVRALAGHDGTIYAGTYGKGFFRSGDDGGTWTEINDSATAQAFVFAMVIDPAGTVYAMTNIGLLASRDRGSSWTVISTLYADIAGGLAIDGSTLYAFGPPFNLARTSDGGVTWEPIINGLDNVDDWVTGVAIHGNTLVAAETTGLYRSADHGESWSRVSTMFGERVAVLSDGTFLAGTVGFGALRSIDDGQTWTESNSGLNDSARVSPVQDVIPGLGATVYLHSNIGGSARSDDGGRTWTMTNDGFVPSPPNISAMTLAGTMLCAAAQPGVYRRSDGEGAWSITAALPGEGSISSLAENATTTWAVEDGQIWRSDDGGSAWITRNAGAATMAADPNDGAIAYAGTARPFGNPLSFHATISRTSDGGATWSVLWTGDIGAGVQTLAVDPRSSQSVYAGLNDGLMRSRDGGATWSAALPGERVLSFAFDSLTVYAATATGVFVSHDDGGTWTRTLSGAAVALVTTTRFVYAATDTALFSTLDHGANWAPVSNSPPGITALASASDRLFAASAGDVFELLDNLYWIRRSDTPAGSPIMSLLFRNERLIAGTSARGVLDLALPLRMRAVRPR